MRLNNSPGYMAAIIGIGAIMSAADVHSGPGAAAVRANPWNESSYIVQAATLQSAREDVAKTGGHIRRDLPIIHGVAADLTEAQAATLSAAPTVHVFKDRAVGTRAKPAPVAAATATVIPVGSSVPSTSSPNKTLSTALTDGSGVNAQVKKFVTNYPLQVNAYPVWQSGITGQGVTIAVIDTGLWSDDSQNFNPRILASVDIVAGGTTPVTTDPYGHGTHVTSIAAGGASTKFGTFFGVAPGANLVIVRAFDDEGQGSYSNVIAGLNWVVANQKKYKIRVLNLSFGATPQSNYWDDPLNQAVMAAWQAGIVVVVSAGNQGPSPMTIGVPGNVPYVITTGALTDNHTPNDPTDDRLASFSSTGPTYEGFVKPEVVAPGGHMVGSMSYQSYLANIDPGSMTKKESLFTMSGTSQAAAVTTGVVALMLQANPNLTPDVVKCRLIASASPAVTSAGTPAYSVFQQGAGLINAVSAINSTASNCANQGLNVAADLAGTEHFGGPANENANGTFYLMNMGASTYGTAMSGAGYSWDQSYSGTQGYAWSQGYAWTSGYAWTQGYAWSQGYAWTQGYAWSQGYAWTQSLPWWGSNALGSVAIPASIDDWVPNE